MEGTGYLTGLTPKDTATGQIIEIKIVVKFAPTIFTDIGALFGKPIDFQIDSPQGELRFDGTKEEADELGREIESRR